MSDYRVTVKVRNARLLRAIRNAGYDSIPKFAAAVGVSYGAINDLVNMTASPLCRGRIRDVVEKVMEFLCEPFEALFSQAQCEALATNKSERDVSAEEVFALMSEPRSVDPLELECRRESLSVDRFLGCLNEREARIVAAHHGLDESSKTLQQIAAVEMVSVDRVRQIEDGAFRKMRRMAYQDQVEGRGFELA